MEPSPQVVELDYDQLQSKLDQIEAVMGSEIVLPFRQLLHWYAVLLGFLREKTISIQRLRKMLFGAPTERTSTVLSRNSSDLSADATPDGEATNTPATDDPPTAGQAAAGQAASEQVTADEQVAGGNRADCGDTSPPTAAAASMDPNSDQKKPRRRPGHGRTPAAAYTGCTQVVITHESLSPGDSCLDCPGTVYRQFEWSLVVRLKGQPPVGGKVYQLERLRCNLCGRVYTAQLPQDAGPDKYDPSVASVIGTLRYGEGLPWNRIQRIQKFAGIPLAASTQWQVLLDAVGRGLHAAYEQIFWLAAQGELVHNDDTAMRVLALTDRLKKQQPLLEDDPDRRGVYTSGILSRAAGRPTIALFFTGPHHCGENLQDVLSKRQQGLPPPIQMCDALSRNLPDELGVIVANCLVHGRRNFVDVVTAFRSEVEYVLQCLEKVYTTEAEAKEQQLSPDQRLRLHQEQSQPVMDELQRWLNQQIDEKRVEPNSSLGGAIAYMLRHWEKLTLFLRVPGAPLDNNICEQALKMAIRHRKNSLFYKTMRGAHVGDLYMSLIHTCYFSGADPIDYMTQLQRNQDRVKASPADWMPWNYRQQLVTAEPVAASNSSTGPPPPDS